MRITFYPMVFMIIATLLHIFLCLVFVIWLDMGIIGLGLAMSTKDGVLILMTIIYSNCSSDVRHILAPFDGEMLKGWGEYLSLSIPATAMLCAEWWAFELLTILAGILGVIELASQTINFSMIALLFMIPLGI